MIKLRLKSFSLIEVTVVIGILSVLSMLGTIQLIRPQITISLDTTSLQIVSDIRSQQLKSMKGNTDQKALSQQHGIKLLANSYVLFSGSTYSPSDTTNTEVTLDTQLNFTNINLTNAEIVFDKLSGEFAAYTPSTNTFRLTNSADGSYKTFSINKLGVINVN